MRSISVTVIAAVLAALANASPSPQELDLVSPSADQTPEAVVMPVLKQATRTSLIRRANRRKIEANRTIVRRSKPSPSAAPDTVSEQDNGLNPVYTQYYTNPQGGYTETDANSGNDKSNYPPVSTTYPGTTTQNDAITSCASFAANSANQYDSFQIWYSLSNDIWNCRAYYDPSANAADFNVADSDAYDVFGYSAYT